MSDRSALRAVPAWRRYAPFVPVLVVFLGSLAFALAKSSELERDMRIAATQNMLWVTSQTQMELQSLTLAASVPDREASEIAQRFDLTLARLSMLQEGPQARYLETLGHLDKVRAMTDEMLALDPQEHGPDPALHDALAELGARLTPGINRIANDVMIKDWDEAAGRLDAYRQTQRLIMAAVVLSLLTALAISGLLLRKQRQLHQADVENLRANRLLEQERDIASMYRDFAAIVSHQLRTPLSLIDSAMHRLERKGDRITPQDVIERREIVSGAIGRLTHLSDTVLLLARLDNDQLQAAFAPVPLDQLAQSTLADAQVRYPGRILKLTTGDGPLTALCDAHLAGHVLENLVSNALKFSEEGQPVEARVFRRGGQIACEVSDKGVGIALKDQPHVFDRYYRGAVQKDGAGLGLSLAQALAELQHGRISFRTVPGEGSVFTFWLPAEDARPARDA